MLFTAPAVRELFEENLAVATDAELVVDGKRIQIHRHYMSLISPVFAAMFKEHTKEAKTGQVNISDFTYETVKQVVDLCYGKDVEEESASKILNLYRFADKYDIASARKKFAAYFKQDVTSSRFAVFITYASEQDDKQVMEKCAKFFKQNTQLALRPDFIALESSLIKYVLELAAKVGHCDKPEVVKVTPKVDKRPEPSEAIRDAAVARWVEIACKQMGRI